MKQARRKFLKKLAFTSVVATGLPQLESFAYSEGKPDKFDTKRGMVILFQGDSITDGNRGRNNDPNHIMGHGYAFTIASRLGADHPKMQYQFYNRGISGNTIVDLANRWKSDTLALAPDILSILVGVNDASSAVFNHEAVVTVDQYEKIYSALLSQTRKAFPGIIPVLCEPFILRVGNVAENWEAYYEDISKRQEIVRSLAKQYDGVYVGFQQVFDQASKEASANYWIWDGVHPTVAGHELMAREWIKQVERRCVF